MSRVVSHSVLYKRGVDHGVVNYGGGRAVSRVVSYSVMDTRGVDQGVVNYGGGCCVQGCFVQRDGHTWCGSRRGELRGDAVSRVVSYSVMDTRGVDQGVVNYGGVLCPGLFRTA